MNEPVSVMSAVKAGGNLRRKFHACFARQAEHHFRCSNGVRIDPVHVGEGTSADVMIDADEKTIFETFEARPVNAVAFENDYRFVSADNAVRLDNLVSEWERTVDARNAIVKHNVGVLAHGAQNLAAGKRRSDGVAIRPGVRGQHETIVLSDLPEYIVDIAVAFLHG
jgi:hypothetical protein